MPFEEKFKMKCEKCNTPTRSMVCLPKRKRKDGTAICFWQVCIKCAKEIIHAKQKKHNVRSVPILPISENAEGRQTKKPVSLRRVQNVVRNVGEKNGKKSQKSERIIKNGYSKKSKGCGLQRRSNRRVQKEQEKTSKKQSLQYAARSVQRQGRKSKTKSVRSVGGQCGHRRKPHGNNTVLRKQRRATSRRKCA